MERDEILSSQITLTYLECFMLNEISQIIWFHSYVKSKTHTHKQIKNKQTNSETKTNSETETKWMAARGKGSGKS